MSELEAGPCSRMIHFTSVPNRSWWRNVSPIADHTSHLIPSAGYVFFPRWVGHPAADAPLRCGEMLRRRPRRHREGLSSQPGRGGQPCHPLLAPRRSRAFACPGLCALPAGPNRSPFTYHRQLPVRVDFVVHIFTPWCVTGPTGPGLVDCWGSLNG